MNNRIFQRENVLKVENILDVMPTLVIDRSTKNDLAGLTSSITSPPITWV